MVCDRFRPDWIAGLYDEEPVDPEARLHLAACADCREELASLARERTALQAAAPTPPAAPRVVMLRDRRGLSPVWTFVSGAAAAVLAFALGLTAAPRLLDPVSPGPLSVVPAATSASSEAAGAGGQDPGEAYAALARRIEALEQAPRPAGSGAAADVRQEIQALEERLDRARARDRELLLQAVAATELRTGAWVDQTREAIQYLALRQDPRLSER